MFGARYRREAAAERSRRMRAEYEYQLLRMKWNALVNRINAHGGEELFRKATQKQVGCQLTQGEIRSLIALCHPDKHNNSLASHKMTQRLLELRG